jgi:hypothetical protein
MRDEMIQEAVFDSIDAIEKARLYSEFEVLMSLTAAYAKSAMIQESSNGLIFDGYEVIQEADGSSESGTDTKQKGGRLKAVGKWFLNLKIVQWIIERVRNLRKKLKEFRMRNQKKGVSKSTVEQAAANAAKAGGKIYVDGQLVTGSGSGKQAYETPEVSVEKKPIKPGDKLTYTASGDIVRADSIEYEGFRLYADIDTLHEAFKMLADAVREISAFGPDSLNKAFRLGENMQAKINEAVQKGTKPIPKTKASDLMIKINEIDELGSEVEKGLMEYERKVKSKSYYDDNGKKISATEFRKNMTDDDMENYSGKKSLNKDVMEEKALKTMLKANAMLCDVCDDMFDDVYDLVHDPDFISHAAEKALERNKKLAAIKKQQSMPSI